MARTIVNVHKTQLSSISRLSEKMRREYYTTNIEKIMNGDSVFSEQESLLLFRSNDQYLDYLKDWYFVKFLIDAFKNPLLEIIQKTDIKVTIKDSQFKNQEDWINNHIIKSNLKSEIVNSLSDMIYYGRFFRAVVYSEEEKTFRLARIKDETPVDFAFQMGDPIGYLIDPGADATYMTRSKAIGAAYMFRNAEYKSIDELDPEIQQVIYKKLGVKDLTPELAKNIVGLETKTPTSTFYAQAGLLFKLYINEILSQFASLRDTFKQNLLAITLSGNAKNTTEAARFVQAVESVVNQDSSVIYNQSVSALIAQMISKILNDTRVLPMVEEYSKAELLDWNDRSADLKRLLDEIDSLRSQILSSFGIPEELFGISSNRWEILSKSDRYLTTITTYADQASNIVRSFAQMCLLNRGYDVDIDDIVFNFQNDTEIQAQRSQHEVDNFDASLSKVNNMLNNFRVLLASGFVDPEKAVDELIDKLQSNGVVMSKSFRSREDIINQLLME